MKAIVFREFGDADVLQYVDVEDPKPSDDEILLEVRAVSVNRTLDLKVRAGEYVRRPKLPHILGVDPSGVVAAVGKNVTDLKVGDRVAAVPSRPKPGAPHSIFGVDRPGGYAQFVAIPAVATVKLPPEVDFAAATVVVRHYPQAFNLLRDRAALAAGEWVLVLGASGGLGSACVEVAKLMGAKVIAGAGADDRVAAAIELGADAGVNYRGEDLTAEVMRITDGAGVQVAVDNIGDADIFASTVQAMSRHGRLVTAGSHGGGRVSLDLTRLYLYQLAIMGSLGSKLSDVHASLEALSRHQIKPLIDRIFPLRSAAQAHRLVEARNGIGKIILDPTMP